QGRHARPSELFNGMQRSEHTPGTRSFLLIPRSRQGGEWSSHQWVQEGFQSQEALLDRSLSLFEQRQRELGNLFLKRSHLGFQGSQSVDRGGFMCGGEGEQTSCGSWCSFMFRRRRALALERRRKQERLDLPGQKTAVGGHASWLPGAGPPASHI